MNLWFILTTLTLSIIAILSYKIGFFSTREENFYIFSYFWVSLWGLSFGIYYIVGSPDYPFQ